MAFDTNLIHGGMEVSHETPLMNYRRFYQMHAAMGARTDAPTAAAWLAAIVAVFGPAIETPAQFMRLDGKAQQRLLEFARARMEFHQWTFDALGARPAYAAQPFSLDYNLSNFNRKGQKEVDCIRFQAEINHATTRGENAALLSAALVAIGLPGTPGALFAGYDPVTARACILFARIYGSAYEVVANSDDNELDFQTAFTFLASRRHDRTFMDRMEVGSWLAEAAFWSATSFEDAFDLLSQTGAGTAATDATAAQVLELFSRLRRGDMDMKPWIPVAELVGHDFLPEMVITLLGLSPRVPMYDENGVLLSGGITLEPTVIAAGGHPQPHTWQVNRAPVEMTLRVNIPVGVTTNFLRFFVSVNSDTKFVIDNAVADDADSIVIGAPFTSGDRTVWMIEIQKAAGWAAGETTLGTLDISPDATVLEGRGLEELVPSAVAAGEKTADDEATITFGGFTTAAGNLVTIPESDGGPPTVLEAGVDFDDGPTAGSANNLAASLAAAIDSTSRTNSAAAVGNVITVTNNGTQEVADITFTGAEIIADVRGASEPFVGFAAAAAGGFFAAVLRLLIGLRLPSTKTLMFAQQTSGTTVRE